MKGDEEKVTFEKDKGIIMRITNSTTKKIKEAESMKNKEDGGDKVKKNYIIMRIKIKFIAIIIIQ